MEILLFLFFSGVIIYFFVKWLLKITSPKSTPKELPKEQPLVRKTITLSDHYDVYETFDLKGVHLNGNKLYFLSHCKEWDMVKIVPEPDNPYNSKALGVYHQGERQLGYIGADDLEEVEELMKLDHTAALETIDYKDDGFLVVHIAIAYKEKDRKKSTNKKSTQSKTSQKKSTTSRDVTPEDFMIWKSNEVPSEYLKPQKDLEDKSHFFYGKKVCISGQLNNFPYRAELAKHLWEVGADVQVNVGKTCGILIAGDGVGPSKLKRAKEQGVHIIEEEELKEKLNGFKSKYI